MMLSSDKVSEIREPILTLDLQIASKPDSSAEHVLLEMTKDEADRMLRSMDTIWENMQKLSS